MNHTFINIEAPEYIKIAMDGADASFIEICDLCGFTIWHEKVEHEYEPCDIFFLKLLSDFFSVVDN